MGANNRILRNTRQTSMADKKQTPGTAKEIGVATRTKPKPKKPSLYRVLILNDDYTPMEFVVHVLKAFFPHHAARP